MRVEDVELHVGRVDRTYTALGRVSAKQSRQTLHQGSPQLDDINGKLRMDAVRLGADAVVQVQYKRGGLSLTSWSSLEASGTAVRWTGPVAQPERQESSTPVTASPVKAGPSKTSRTVEARLADLERLRIGGLVTDTDAAATRARILEDL
jgi:hypothetical protein